MSDRTDEVRKAVKFLWELTPDEETAEALIVVLPIVDEWIEQQSSLLSMKHRGPWAGFTRRSDVPLR